MRGDGQNQLKISAPHPMTETQRLISLLAALISLDSPFNHCLAVVDTAEFDSAVTLSTRKRLYNYNISANSKII
jgi:hypothetical protein